MSTDYFLKLGDIKGESKADGHVEEIIIESFSWAETNSGTSGHGGGGGAGKVSMQDFTFSSSFGTQSPPLQLACASGKHYDKAVLTCRRQGDKQQEYLKYTLYKLLVSSYGVSGGSGSVVPSEQFSLNFAKIECEYKAQDEKGNLGGSIKWGWDLDKGIKV